MSDSSEMGQDHNLRSVSVQRLARKYPSVSRDFARDAVDRFTAMDDRYIRAEQWCKLRQALRKHDYSALNEEFSESDCDSWRSACRGDLGARRRLSKSEETDLFRRYAFWRQRAWRSVNSDGESWIMESDQCLAEALRLEEFLVDCSTDIVRRCVQSWIKRGLVVSNRELAESIAFLEEPISTVRRFDWRRGARFSTALIAALKSSKWRICEQANREGSFERQNDGHKVHFVKLPQQIEESLQTSDDDEIAKERPERHEVMVKFLWAKDSSSCFSVFEWWEIRACLADPEFAMPRARETHATDGDEEDWSGHSVFRRWSFWLSVAEQQPPQGTH